MLFVITFQAPVGFFDVTPIGRIMNRFSTDLYSIDDALPFILNIFLAQFYGLLGTLAITCYGLPWFSLLLVPLGIIYYFIQVVLVSLHSTSMMKNIFEVIRNEVVRTSWQNWYWVIYCTDTLQNIQICEQICEYVNIHTICRWCSHL